MAGKEIAVSAGDLIDGREVLEVVDYWGNGETAIFLAPDYVAPPEGAREWVLKED